MTVPYVCSTCCNRIARQSVLSGKRQVAFASSHALEGVLAEHTTASQPRQRPRYSRPPVGSHDVRAQRQSHPKRRGQDSPSQPFTDFTSYIASATTKTSGRYSHQQQQPQSDLSATKHNDRPRPTSRPVRPYTSELEEMVTSGQLSKAWLFLLEHYTDVNCPALTRPSYRDVAKVRSGAVFGDLLTRVTAAWLIDPRAESVPSPAEVLKQYEELGLASSTAYAKTIWKLSTALLGTHEHEIATHVPSPHRDIHQLMDLWSLCLTRQPVQSESPDLDVLSTSTGSPWSFASGDLVAQLRGKGQGRNFDDCFALFVPCALSDKGRFNQLAASALLTHDMLVSSQSSTRGDSDDLTKYTEFVTSVELLLHHTTIDSKRLSLMSQRLKEGTSGTDAVTNFMQRLEARVQVATPAAQEQKPRTPENADSKLQRHINRLGRAVEREDLDYVETLWSQTPNLLSPLPSNNSSSINVYEQFLVAFFRLRRPQSALIVWNAMVQSGVQPTVRTWTVMMKGCQISKDVVIMESMWRRMRDSGVQPDTHAWSTRIHGLLKVGKFQEGLQALDEMSREWADASRQQHGRKIHSDTAKRSAQESGDRSLDERSIPKPDTAVLNSAMSALKGRGKQYIPNLLTWSRSLGIDPDVITYNSLLNICLAQGEQEEAMNILKTMADSNVAPDSSTLTILLNAMFHSSVLKELEHPEQEEYVMNFVLSLESNGVSIDEKGYSLLIDRLLKEYNNTKAVQRILAHMADSKVAPTAHIYTILMTHYFDANPPNLPAADALWNDIQSRSHYYGAALDVIFYDRMVEGYSRHGDVGRTMAFLTRMSKEGKRPGWLAMAAVIKCLAEKNDWDRLTQIVLDCHRQEGLLNSGLRGTKGQAEFWRLVRDMGVLDHLAIDVD